MKGRRTTGRKMSAYSNEYLKAERKRNNFIIMAQATAYVLLVLTGGWFAMQRLNQADDYIPTMPETIWEKEE